MITARQASDWRGLQRDVARILRECGFAVEVEKIVPLVRGEAEIDVHAVESIRGRAHTIFCECKLWQAPIPQTVIHSFQNVVEWGGANTGYVITSSSFQSGAQSAAHLTNVRLVTWEEFQVEFEGAWISHHLRHHIVSRLDRLLTHSDTLLPAGFADLDDRSQQEYLKVHDRYFDLGMIAWKFSPYGRLAVPDLPIRRWFEPRFDSPAIPEGLLDAIGYQDFLDILVPAGESAIAELDEALGRRPPAADPAVDELRIRMTDSFLEQLENRARLQPGTPEDGGRADSLSMKAHGPTPPRAWPTYSRPGAIPPRRVSDCSPGLVPRRVHGRRTRASSARICGGAPLAEFGDVTAQRVLIAARLMDLHLMAGNQQRCRGDDVPLVALSPCWPDRVMKFRFPRWLLYRARCRAWHQLRLP
jgi:restriction system protein